MIGKKWALSGTEPIPGLKDRERKRKKRCGYILSRKKTSFFEKLNQTHSILLQFTQYLHLLTANHQTKTLISSFFLLMPSFLRNGSFLFVLQSQPFYQAQLVPVTTIAILRSSLALELKRPSQPFTKRNSYL